MVGFGSSLRMARRPGWEDAYLDYETLKLLLTQIEAVYEEEAHFAMDPYNRNNGSSYHGGAYSFRSEQMMMWERGGGSKEGGGNSPTAAAASGAPRDYRDDLFLESDSDKAFEMLMKCDYYSATEGDQSDIEQQQQQQQVEFENQQLQQQMQQQQQQQQQQVEDDNTSMINSIFSERREHHQRRPGGSVSGNTAAAGSTIAPFSAYPSEYGSLYGREVYSGFDEYDDDDSQDGINANCVPIAAAWKGKPKKKKDSKDRSNAASRRQNSNTAGTATAPGRRGNFLSPTTGENSDFFLSASNPNHHNNDTDAFILDASTAGYTEDDTTTLQSLQPGAGDGRSTLTSFSQAPHYQGFEDQTTSSILKKPFRRNGTGSSRNQQASLLTPTPGPGAGTTSVLHSFASPTGPVTPPQSESGPSTYQFDNNPHYQNHYRSLSHENNGNNSIYGFSFQHNRHDSSNLQMPPLTNANPRITKAQQEKLEAQRKQERQQRRRRKRKRAKQRKDLERKVPRHIRRAHTKARDITERFLGLLRAECEKVMLFAQSRLGELADTVGSLRFPNMEDQHSNNPHNHHQIVESVPLSPNSASNTNAAVSYEGYPLSDGGMHPSASSSSDDGAGGGAGGTFYWSDSSSNDSARVSPASNGSPTRGLSAMKELHHKRKSSTNSGGAHVDNLKERVSGQQKRESLSKGNNKRNKHDGFDSTKRHLDHFEKLRRNRPIFQRNGHIVGEDLLLLSAVDEADGYTAVGVELLHVLRFICVNLIAVRKICRKHDRLLMNRMLGGYYHHLKMIANGAGHNANSDSRKQQPQMPKSSNTPEASFKDDEHVQNAQTLGGLLARESGDIFEVHHPAVIGQGLNNYKLVGLYDSNLQQLANSRTVQVISSCLVLALSEYEVSRSRANALATLNTAGSGVASRRDSGNQRVGMQSHQQQDQMSVLTGFDNPKGLDDNDEYDSDHDGGAPSTASSISLTRLRFTVTSLIAMREAARRKSNMYASYLSRSMLAFTGRAVIGDGMDGCSRETLDFLASYNPDAALLMDPATLNEGLKQGLWSKRAISSVMASSLAIATTPVELPSVISAKNLDKQGKAVMDALNLLPKATFLEVPELFKGQLTKKSNVTKLENEAFRSVLRLNRMAHLLYNMNYYVVHPTTITFVKAIASPAAHSALIIGAPSLSAILASLLHCYVLSGDSKAPLKSFKSLRWLFIFAALFGVVGNAVHLYGIWQHSVPIAVAGRFVFGLSSSEILHRHIVASCLPMPVSRIVSETATLVQAQVAGTLLGLLVGTLAEYLPYHMVGWGIRSLASSSWLMGFLWFVQLLLLCCFFTVNKLMPEEAMETANAAEVEELLTSSKATISRIGQDSDSTGSGPGTGEPLSRQTSLQLTYGATEGQAPSDDAMETSNARKKKKKRHGKGRKRRMKTIKSFPGRLRRLFTYSIAVPLCILTILFIRFAQESLFSSCPVILDRYFSWGGGRAGIFLACLTFSTPFISFTCGHIARKYEERTIVKRSVVILGIGLFVMINFGSFIALASQVTDLLDETVDLRHERMYDWLFGIVQYFVGLTLSFLGLTALDSATLSLLSKVSPPRIRSSSVALQLGTIVSFVGMSARVLADLQILMIGLSHRLINTDLVNALVIPLLFICFIVGHFVRKHFFFLM